MPVTVHFHRLASKDYLKARGWYSRRSLSAARSFQDEVAHAVAEIADDPRLLFYYIIDDQNVVVLAVAHARRQPGYWLRRSRS